MTVLARAASSLAVIPEWVAHRLEPTAMRWHRQIAVLLHVVLIAASNYIAFWLRFDGEIPAPEASLFLQALPPLLVIRGLTFYKLRLFQGLWRYTSLWDLRNIVIGVGLSSALFYVIIHWIGGQVAYPRSVFLIDSMLLVCLMGGVRLAYRISPGLLPSRTRRRVLVIGAGDAGEMIVREMRLHREYGCEPVGFVEDDPRWRGQSIHGVPVLGGLRDLVRIMLAVHPHEVLIAVTSPEPAIIRRVVKLLEPFKVHLTRLPLVTDLVNGNGDSNGSGNGSATVTDIRQLRVEDLLDRVPIGLDPEPVRRLIEGRRILVTGAGGSIGSELCRQIARWSPSRLVLYERFEGGLYGIDSQLRDAQPDGPFAAVIGDVTDTSRLDRVFALERPEIIFHAAAHKHVPLMETNPCEAIKNNAIGTLRVAEAAVRHRVGQFVLISTDKAVHPSSVMGASKRVAELIVQSMVANSGSTRFATVRFGNVLGSSGSVVPRFLEQVKAGGPVTVTHPEISRYFMLIPEAVQLVLQAAAIGQPGAVYVLDMGQPIKLVDLARNLIRLSGHVPDEDIMIAFTGLRPGEKLSEELVDDNEVVEASPVDKILQVRARPAVALRIVQTELMRLVEAATAGDANAVLRTIARIVPTFRHAPVENGVPLTPAAVPSPLATAVARLVVSPPAAPAISPPPPPSPPPAPVVRARARGMSG
jgi:FlaA1/EpsC-like NDP-sugar epimerase